MKELKVLPDVWPKNWMDMPVNIKKLLIKHGMMNTRSAKKLQKYRQNSIKLVKFN